jgi:hypothetical protein
VAVKLLINFADIDVAVPQAAAEWFRSIRKNFRAVPPNQSGLPVFPTEQTQTTGVAMDHRNDLVPLTLMGALTAAILTVFVVTVHM